MSIALSTTTQPRRKIKPLITVENKTRTTLCLPKTMLNAIHRFMEQAGISRKKRSRWIEGTVQRLLQQPHFEVLVLEEFLDSKGNVTIPVTLSKMSKNRINDIVTTFDGRIERSQLLRTAISQYLLKNRIT